VSAWPGWLMPDLSIIFVPTERAQVPAGARGAVESPVSGLFCEAVQLWLGHSAVASRPLLWDSVILCAAL
jgi:hypothetical protein